jgi:hypothetical protein
MDHMDLYEFSLFLSLSLPSPLPIFAPSLPIGLHTKSKILKQIPKLDYQQKVQN